MLVKIVKNIKKTKKKQEKNKIKELEKIQKKQEKNKIKEDKPSNCSICNCVLKGRGKTNMCNKCLQSSKSKCPTLEELKDDIRIIKTKVCIGKKYGVSDNAVKNG